MKAVILIAGHAQNGKTTFGNMLKTEFGLLHKKAIVAQYGDFLKMVVKNYFGWSGEKDEKGRTLLQKVGTEIFRKNSSNCWVNMMINFAQGLGETVDYLIIPDTRFPNEIDEWAIQTELSIYDIKICRKKGDKEFDNGLTLEQKRHQSEIALDGWVFDFEVINNKELSDLGKKAQIIVQEIERRENDEPIIV